MDIAAVSRCPREKSPMVPAISGLAASVVHDGHMRFGDLSAIQRLIDNRVTESSSLEFKSDLDLTTTRARKELLKDLTGMGNGGGGTIVFGLDEDPVTKAAKEFTPLPSDAITGQIEDIVRSAVRTPMLWSFRVHEKEGGWVVVVDVEPSPLGPYMVDAYKDQRFYMRSGSRVHQMSEHEARTAYAVAERSREQRDQAWRKHRLPMQFNSQEPWLVISALPLEPLSEIFESRAIDLRQFAFPPPLARYTTPLAITSAAQFLRHWAGGVAGDDGHNDVDPRTYLRLHRDGAVGMAMSLYPELEIEPIARLLNAHLLYLAWFWEEFSLQRPVEIEIELSGLKKASMPANSFGTGSRQVVEPAGVSVPSVGSTEEVLPWELVRAPVRHRIVRRFSDRLEQAFGRTNAKPLFEEGLLYGKDGPASDLLLGNNLIYTYLGNGHTVRQGWIDTAGQVRGACGICAFAADGVVFDDAGDTLAVLEMAPGVGCPDNFLHPSGDAHNAPRPEAYTPDDGPAGIDIPHPTGRWSQRTLLEVLQPAAEG